MADLQRSLDIHPLGIRVELLRTAADTGGKELEFEVIGRPRGFLALEHVHSRQVERHEVVSGSMKLVLDGRQHILRSGDAMEVPAGAPHRQLAPGDAPAHVRITVRPAGSTQQFLERLADLSRDGRISRLGLPKPVAAAELIRDFGAEGRATRPPLAVQRSLASFVMRVAAIGAREYVFVDEWEVDAPQEAVFDALADARTYPRWWGAAYIDVEADGPPTVGAMSRHHFKGPLPYELRTISRIVRIGAPHLVQSEVDGDLRGVGTWTLTSNGNATHVRFDWRVIADKPLLRVLTPLLRRLFRWNHNWAIARAKEGLEPYARRRANSGGEAATPAAPTR